MASRYKYYKDLYLILIRNGGDPYSAYIDDPQFQLEEYELARKHKRYNDFEKKVKTLYEKNIDGRLLGVLYECQKALKNMDTEHYNYPKIQKNYLDILKLSVPLVKRLQRYEVEVEQIEGMELIIDDDEID